MANYRKLIVWQKAHELALLIYRLTDKFPMHERYALATQIRRAALSIPTNIVRVITEKAKKNLSIL